MGKRKREAESEGSLASTSKRGKKDVDPCGKFISLAGTDDSLLAALTFFLTTVERDGNTDVIDAYLQSHPDCSHFLRPLTWTKEKRSFDTLLLCFSCLEKILLHTTSTPSSSSSSSKFDHTIGRKLVQSLLASHMRPVYFSITSYAPNGLTAAALQLLTAMVAQGPRAARDVQVAFNFNFKPVGLLAHRTAALHGSAKSVRSCFIKFALSFLIFGDHDVITEVLLHRYFLPTIFVLLPKDSPETIHLILSTLQQKVVLHPEINKKTKSKFFNSFVLKLVAQLLTQSTRNVMQDSSDSSGTSQEQFVFDFIILLSTNFHHGICYRYKSGPLSLQSTNNPSLLRLVSTLPPSTPLLMELIVKMISACPDMLLPYLELFTFPLEPKSSSKWLANMELLIQLFGALPSLGKLLGHSPPLSCLPVAVGFTVPSVTSRTILSHGLQSPSMLVCQKSLCLMQVALSRAAALLDTPSQPLRDQEGDEAFLLQYCDSVLKLLPDIKTLITLRQQLATGGRNGRWNEDGEFLTSEERIRSAALLSDSTLLRLAVSVMHGYLKLSPIILAQVNFNLSKLLPPSSFPGDLASRDLSHDPGVILATLELLLDVSVDVPKWQQQGSSGMSSLLHLALSADEGISSTAIQLLMKLLLSCDTLQPHRLDLEVILSSLRHYHSICSLDNEISHQLVTFLGNVFTSVVRDPYRWLANGEVGGVAYGVDGEDGAEEVSKADLLKRILAGPVILPEGVVGENAMKDDHPRVKLVCPVVPCLLTKFSALDVGPNLLFVSLVLLRLSAVSEVAQQLSSVVLHYLEAPRVNDKYMSSSWQWLYFSLCNYFWSRGKEHIVGTAGGLSARETFKKLKKMRSSGQYDACTVFGLLSSMERDALLELIAAAEEEEGVRELIVKYIQMRPLHLANESDDSSVSVLHHHSNHGAVKTLIRLATSPLATGPQLASLVSSMVQLLCTYSEKVRKQLLSTSSIWCGPQCSWNESQLSLVGGVALSAGDTALSATVAKEAMQRLEGLIMASDNEEVGDEESIIASLLMKLVKILPEDSCFCPSELWGKFVHSSLRRRFKSPLVMQLLSQCLGPLYSSPTIDSDVLPITVIFDMVWSHSKFLEVMCSLDDEAQDCSCKECVVQLLVGLASRCSEMFKSEHVALLLSAYSATRSKCDRGLLYLLFLYEEGGVSTAEYRPYLWGPAALEHYRSRKEVGWLLWKQPSTREVTEQLNWELLRQSTNFFPLDCLLEPSNPFVEASSRGNPEEWNSLYDPCFLLPLFSHLLDSSSVVNCRRFVEIGCLGYLVTGLSSRDKGVRMCCRHSLSLFWDHLEGTRFGDKSKIRVLLEVLRNSFDDGDARLPSIMSAFAVSAAHLFLHPEDKMYTIVARFVVQKPFLILNDIPLFQMLLHSSSSQHSHELQWLLGLLASGLRCSEDYILYRKRGVFAQLMVLHGSPLADHRSKNLIMDVVERGCNIPAIGTALVWDQGLLSWMLQIPDCERNHIRLVKILQNVCEDHLLHKVDSGYVPPPLIEEECLHFYTSLWQRTDSAQNGDSNF